LGHPLFPDSRELLVVSDLAGVKGKTSRAWKLALQQLTNETGLTITVCYFPPGTTRWSRVDHSMASETEIEVNARRVRMEAVTQLIGSRSSAAGMILRPEFEDKRQQLTLQSLET